MARELTILRSPAVARELTILPSPALAPQQVFRRSWVDLNSDNESEDSQRPKKAQAEVTAEQRKQAIKDLEKASKDKAARNKKILADKASAEKAAEKPTQPHG